MVHQNCRLASTPIFRMVDCLEMTDVLELERSRCHLLMVTSSSRIGLEHITKILIVFIGHVLQYSHIMARLRSISTNALILISSSVLTPQINPQYHHTNDLQQVRNNHTPYTERVQGFLVVLIEEGTGNIPCAVTDEEDPTGCHLFCMPCYVGSSQR